MTKPTVKTKRGKVVKAWAVVRGPVGVSPVAHIARGGVLKGSAELLAYLWRDKEFRAAYMEKHQKRILKFLLTPSQRTKKRT